jgi:hypothetical protein
LILGRYFEHFFGHIGDRQELYLIKLKMWHKTEAATIAHGDIYYCSACKQHFDFVRPSKIQRHINTKVHRQNIERVGGGNLTLTGT